MNQHTPPASPATDLLGCLQRGDTDAALDLLAAHAPVSVPQLDLSLVGVDAVRAALPGFVSLFPDISYRPYTRHVGSTLVIDQASIEGTQAGGQAPTGIELQTSARISVTHDEKTVQAIIVDVDLPPLLRALGRPVDSYAMAVSQVQSLSVHNHPEGMVTYRLEDRPTRPATEPGHAVSRRPRATRQAKVAAATAVVAMALAAGVWSTTHRGEPAAAAISHPVAKTSTKSKPKAKLIPSPAALPSPGLPPATKKPNVVLKSDLAFGFDSAQVSNQAREAIQRVARQARAAGLTGAILVLGYTDNLGSAKHGLLLSQHRADAVATILRAELAELRDTHLSVTAEGLGERDPGRSNATAAGRAANRRVTITLPSQ